MDEVEFTVAVRRLVAASAPRLFAIVQQRGDCVDGWVAAWGMAFADHAEVVSADGQTRSSLRSPASAIRHYSSGGHLTTHLLWVQPDALPSLDAET